MARKARDIYGGRDPREVAQYAVWEAAHLLKIPRTTLQQWVSGRDQFDRKTEPVIMLPDPQLKLLSFINLVEAHVLDAIRYKHQVPLRNVRRAMSYLRDKYQSAHPLAEYAFEESGVDLMIREEQKILNISRSGQLAFREVVEAYLKRVEYDLDKGIAAYLYPYLKRHPQELEEPKLVLIDPRISFGKPVLVGVGVPTAVIADRHDAGEKIGELAKDYGCEPSQIKQAIDYERALPKAA